MPIPNAAQLQNQLMHISFDMQHLCDNPTDITSAIDLLNRSYKTPAAAAARQRLHADPAIAALVQERYWGEWPNVATLITYPAGSLGYVYGHLLFDQGLEPLAPPQLSADISAADSYLQHRIRACHDVWHAITGSPATIAGESALNGFTAEQLRWPGSALLLAAGLIHRSFEATDPDGPDIGLAIAYGLKLGCFAPPFLAERWEQGWDLPLTTWRTKLGINELCESNPFTSSLR
ncbi:MAG: hypothetical protein BTM30_01635 [Synechococcus lacustris str. Tous]|nr:MAG: hypothetical protein BTM30_01635 [Synechococcus lacustris str. Tous]